jgi:hypothetical protein
MDTILDQILSHTGQGRSAEFEVKWQAGDITWIGYQDATRLDALQRYCEAHGVDSAIKLPAGRSRPDDPPVLAGYLGAPLMVFSARLPTD